MLEDESDGEGVEIVMYFISSSQIISYHTLMKVYTLMHESSNNGSIYFKKVLSDALGEFEQPLFSF